MRRSDTELIYRPLDEVRRDVERVMREHPRLSANGFGFGGLVQPAEFEWHFREAREAMLSESFCLQFERARTWLQQCARTTAINSKITSYGLKHEAERWLRAGNPHSDCYVSNGMFIAAAIHLGFEFHSTDNSADDPNVFLNLALPKTAAVIGYPGNE